MTLVKFNQKPFERTFNSLFEDLFQNLPAGTMNKDWGNLSNGFAPVNIKETKEGYQVDVVAPGMEKADFKINMDQNLLTISAEKKTEVKNENERQVRQEFSVKSFTRSFTLDESINSAEISAKYENGVLTLNLPKIEEVKQSPKQISVQ